jgi:ketosteroid isomerase-like protein
MKSKFGPAAAAATLAVATCGACAQDLQGWRAQVEASERAFAKTMADRDLAGFAGFIAQEAVFFSASPPLRGRADVVERWKVWFEKPEAPFSWEPDQVEVLASGQLALSSGPVRDPHGVVVSRFNSIWRQESPGVWKVVFDKGEPLPAAAKR